MGTVKYILALKSEQNMYKNHSVVHVYLVPTDDLTTFSAQDR